MVDIPETRFAKIGTGRIAYQVVGDGPVDLIYLSSRMGDCIDLRWDYPPYAKFMRRLASFTRLITFDPRGIGASDPLELDASPDWERWADEARGVLDIVGTQRAAILGQSDAASIAVLFAAAHPDRTQALVLGNSAARYMAAPDYALGMAESEVRPLQVAVAEAWGTETLAELMAPGGDPALRRWLAKANRLACSQQAVIAHLRRLELLDVREALPVIRIPTLVLHRQGCPIPTLDQGRHLADNIPGARFEAVPGTDTTIWNTPNARILDLIEEFLTGISPHEETDRALAAILFTDIVGSTERAADMGDRRWRALLETHDAVARAIVAQHHGRLVKLTGDGVLATFDGPGRAIRATLAFRDALRSFDIDIRAGLHAGEIELRSDDISGIGVHVAARVLDHADSGELLVSGAVPMLVAGSGIEFDDRGEHELKGIPGVWKLFAVEV